MNKKALTRGFHIDGATYYFNFKEFQRAFRNYNLHINQETTTLTKCEELLAEKCKCQYKNVGKVEYKNVGFSPYSSAT